MHKVLWNTMIRRAGYELCELYNNLFKYEIVHI